ncbi:MAG: hypothetical protein AAF799_23800 [Myxococcota bacterium]
MRSLGLAVAGVATVFVVGYAAYTLQGSKRSPRAQSEVVDEAPTAKPAPRRRSPATVARGQQRPSPPAAPVQPPRFPDKAAEAAPPPAPEPPRGGPPPRPVPTVGLEQARRNYTDFMAELDQLIDSGRTLDNAEWTDYYRRGHEALQPLLQHLRWSEPEEARELRTINEDLRNKLHELQPQAPGPR